MPELDSKIHMEMLESGQSNRSLLSRLRKAASILFARQDLYGLEWGDPETNPPLKYVRDHFLLPYVFDGSTIVEIGPGGGRWTRYMLDAKKIYAVDYHIEVLDELKKNFSHEKNVAYIKNQGTDFPEIEHSSIDFIFSFGTFVHLDVDIIESYLSNIKPLIKQDTNVVIQYSDKTKPLGRANEGFSDNDPERMRGLVLRAGYEILEEDTKTLWHSSIIRFGASQK